MTMFSILINGFTVLNNRMEPMKFKSYAAAEMYARLHFMDSPDVSDIVIQGASIINGLTNHLQAIETMKELVSKINAEMEAFQIDASKAAEGNKAAGQRARKASLNISKMLLEFRKVSVKA